MKESKGLVTRGLRLVAGCTVANKLFNIVVYALLVVLLLDQLLGLVLARVCCSDTAVSSSNQVCTD